MTIDDFKVSQCNFTGITCQDGKSRGDGWLASVTSITFE